MSADVRTIDKPWKDFTYVAIDTETSGQYPIADEIVEIALVKWKGDREIDSYQALFKPKKPMGEAVIKIHSITNEMVADAPPIESKLNEILKFIEGCVVIAHHAPFDVGFLAWEFEKIGKNLPNDAIVCSSLLSRAVIESPTNHKLQTMISLLDLTQTQAHRADSDARACLQLALLCMNKVGENATLKEIVKTQKRTLWWQDYSLKAIEQNQKWRGIFDALYQNKNVEFIYESGSHKGKPRIAKPLGIVRNPDGDFFPAFCDIDKAVKRFYLSKISDSLVCN